MSPLLLKFYFSPSSWLHRLKERLSEIIVLLDTINSNSLIISALPTSRHTIECLLTINSLRLKR